MVTAVDVDHQTADRFGVAKSAHQLLADHQRLGRVAGRRGRTGPAAADGSFERQCGQVALQAVRQQVDLILLPLLQFLANVYRAAGKCQIGESAGPLQHRRQRLALVDGILAGEPHLAREFDGSGFHPLRNGFDDQDVIGLEHEVRARIAAANRREIHRNQLGSPRIALLDVVAGDLSLAAKCGIFQAAAGADQIADMHGRLERIVPRRLDPAVDADDLLGLIRRWLAAPTRG